MTQDTFFKCLERAVLDDVYDSEDSSHILKEAEKMTDEQRREYARRIYIECYE